MDPIAAGFWGAYFAAAAFVFFGSIAAFIRSEHPVGLRAAWSAVASAFFVAAFLDFLPIDDEGTRLRFLAFVAVTLSTSLAYLLMAMMGVLRSPQRTRRTMSALIVTGLIVLGAGLALEPQEAFLLGAGMAAVLAVIAMVLCAVGMLRAERLAGLATLGVLCMLISILCLTDIALASDVPMELHIVAAVAGTLFLVAMSIVGWQRYSYLIDLHEVLAHGPSYDPVTRMRSHSETGQMVGAAFQSEMGSPVPLGVIVVSIGNLYALEKLHGAAAVNHALFVCAGRLRRYAPMNADMGRLGEDAFLLLVRSAHSMERLIELARRVAERLSRGVVLSIGRERQPLEGAQMRWEAQVGVGVLAVSSAQVKAGTAVAMAKAMSRTAWTYPTRVAWFDEHTGQISEVVDEAPAATEPAHL